MKETKLLIKESSRSEEEKSRLEQFEENLKNAVFSVYYLLLKNQETTFWKFVVLLIIEYFQLFSFSFDQSMIDAWQSTGVVKYFSEFLETFRVVYWLEQLTFDIYVIIFYIIIFLVFVTIIDFMYVSITYKHKRYSFMQPIQILRIASILIISILYVPIIEFFFTISECKKDSQGVLMHYIFPTVQCFASIHILHATLSYIMIILFAMMATLSCTLHYESRYTKDPTSKINARADMFQLFSKTLYCFIFTFFSDDEYALFKSIVLSVFSTVSFIQYVSYKPYFNSTTQTLVEMFAGVFVWTNYVVLISQLIKNTLFNGALEIYLLGIPIICGLIYTMSESRLRLLMTAENRLQQGHQCQKKNFFYLHIIETKELDRYSAIILKGYINHHVEVCPYDSCPIKAFKRQIIRDKQTLEIDRKKKLLGSKSQGNGSEHQGATGNNSLLLAQAKALYNNGIIKFPKYTALRIDYANFLQSRMKDRKGALNELVQAEKVKPAFDHQFMIFRQRKIIEDELTEGQEHGGIDFIAALNFENSFKAFKQMIDKSAMLHQEFWNHLLDDSPDLVRLSQQGAKINVSIQSVEDQWKKLSKMSTNTPKALKLYATYLIEILNDKETGNEQMMKAKEAANLRVNFEFNNINEDYTDLNNYAQDGTPCIYISGEQERLGIVNQCNMSLCKVFGYNKKDDVINKDVEMLMPKTFSENHKDFLGVSSTKSADQISSRERQVFGKHFSGYIFPLWLQIKNLPSLLSGRQYVATFKVEKTGINKSVAHILLGKDKQLLDISPSCITMLGITYDKLNRKQIYYDMASILPQLFQASSQVYQNKAGGSINYHYPKVIETDNKKNENEIGQVQIGDQDDEKPQRKDSTETANLGVRSGQGGQSSLNDNYSQIDQQDYMDEDGFSPQKKLTKELGKQNTKKDDDQDDEQKDDDADFNINQYQFKAVGNADRVIPFQCNLTEIFFELVNLSGGYHLRLESINEKQVGANVGQQMEKKNAQTIFQFTYDPIYKRFVRELRDSENKDYYLDKNYLSLKHLKDHYRQQEALQQQIAQGQDEDQQQHTIASKYIGMSYMGYLNKQQRMIDKGIKAGKDGGGGVDGLLDEEDENLSEDNSSNGSENNTTKNNKDPAALKADLTSKQALLIPTPVNNDFMKQLQAMEGSGKDFLRGEIERLIRILQERQSVCQGVHTFIRIEGHRKGWEESQNQAAGLFQNRGDEIQKIEEEEEQNEQGDKEKDKDSDQLKANIKSKKAFSMAINDKTMPPSIKRLSRTGQLILLTLIAFAIADYSIVNKQYNDTKENFMLIEEAYLRTAELQKVAFNARTMVLLNQKLQTTYMGFANQSSLVAAIKADLSNSLNTIYDVQNEINLSQLSVDDEQDQLLNNKTVNLYFQEDVIGMKALQFSLTESILQISSTIFTVSNMDVSSFNETNEDVFFLLYNSFNDFYQALTLSSSLYVQELYDRSNEKEEIGFILYLLALASLMISQVFLIPVVHSVNKQKDKVLSLFCEIDNNVIRVLSLRCERFINNLQAEEGNDDIDSNEDIENNMVQDDDDEYNLLSGAGKRLKKAKGKTKTDLKFFLKFVVALQFVHAYFMANFILGRRSIQQTQILGQVLNVTAFTEPYYWFALNVQREMIYNPSRPVINSNSSDVAKAEILNLYQENNDLQESHLAHESYLDSTYWSDFEVDMKNDTCDNIPYYGNSTNSTACQNFISGLLTQGLHATIIMYFETLRSTLSTYQTDQLNKTNQTAIGKQIFNSQDMLNLYVMQNYVIQVFMRDLVSSLSTSIQNDYSFMIERKIAIFICFLIIVLVAFFIFWLPFLNGLNYQIYKTKLMLMIIPLEVLMKIKNVGKVLQSQSFLTGNQGSANKKKASA